ncbi:MAG: hypothetical protein IT317_08270 [Anaerolineales bacterium]|nr:hypothetical protein [Anaerolineales bacterium]
MAETATIAWQLTDVAAGRLKLTQQAGQEESGSAGGVTPIPAASGGPLITFDILADQAVFNGDGKPGYLSSACWPPHHNADGAGYLTLAADGTLAGSCSGRQPDVELRGTLTGRWDEAAGTMSFHLVTNSGRVGPEGTEGHANLNVVYHGAGPIVNGAATGPAAFTYTCDAVPDVHCADFSFAFTVSGTVPFTMQVVP